MSQFAKWSSRPGHRAGMSSRRLAAAIIDPTGPKAVVLIRIAVGVIFTSEGIQKFLYPDSLGAGRFAKIGIPAAEVLGPFVGVVEMICGLLILLGLLTRLAALPLIIDMLVAIASTKVPILLGRGYFLFAQPSVAKTGFWSMLHEARTDLAMLLGATFLVLVGAGAWSLDAVLSRRRMGARMATGAPLGLVLALTVGACVGEPSDSPLPAASEGEAWLLSGNNDERFARVARQLRGFDVAMVETGYRYGELYWAGQDRNWDYAKYQVEKIRTAVENGVERRPKRGLSAQMLEGPLGSLEEAIAAEDPGLFDARFSTLTTTCNACHQAERVPFVQVQPPSIRLAPLGPVPAD